METLRGPSKTTAFIVSGNAISARRYRIVSMTDSLTAPYMMLLEINWIVETAMRGLSAD